MDRIDRIILSRLENDSRIPFLKIAKELDVSEGTIRKRVSKLKKQGIIRKFTISSSKGSSAILCLTIDKNKKINDMIDKLKKMDIFSIYHVAGDFEIICIINQLNPDSMENLLYSIKKIQGIGDVKIYPVLKEI
ncbi:MAG: Lrp/AsnC family transcriptional regulator [Candidatus Woesearchaeota archaeon]